MTEEIKKITQLSAIADQYANAIAQIEQEVNRLTGGDATVGEVVAVMVSLGWMSPAGPQT